MADEIFELTDEHVTLIKNMVVGWQDCETGAPEVDPKRPYGNSDVARDVAELLEVEVPEDHIPATIESQLLALHRETEKALQIYLQHGDAIGAYQRQGYSNWWLPL